MRSHFQKQRVQLNYSQKRYWPWYSNDSANCVDIKLGQGATDEEYLSRIENEVVPVLKSFNPDIIGVSAGFDTNQKDRDYLEDSRHPEDLSYFNLTRKSLERIKEILRDYPHFAILEGGYNPESVEEGVKVFTRD